LLTIVAQRLGQGLAQHLLGAALAVHLGRVEQPQAQLDGQAHRLHLGGAAALRLAVVPGAQAQGG
jgi:hypothetical protein